MENIFEYIIFLAFILYLFVLDQYTIHIPVIYYVVMEYTGQFHILSDQINVIPFRTIFSTFSSPFTARVEIIQAVGNLLLLAPFAFALLSLQIVKTAKKTIFLLAIMSISFEVFQFVISLINSGFKFGEGRSSDIDDVILNTISAFIGVILFYVYRYVKRILEKDNRAGTN